MNQLFKPTGYNQQFFEPLPKTFLDYQRRCQAMLKAARCTNHYFCEDNYIQMASPFEMGPSQASRGLLLLHGLLESPFLLRDIGHYFSQHDYRVRSILLPGHATGPGDLLNIHHNAWQQACHYGIDSLSQTVDELYLCGYSTGALLALLACYTQNISKIKGLILFTPAIKIKYYAPLLVNGLKGLSHLIPTLRWLTRCQEKDYARYHSLPLNAAYQVYQLSRQLITHHQRAPITLPIFMVTTWEDAVIDCFASLQFLKQQPHSQNRIVIYTPQAAAQQRHTSTLPFHYSDPMIIPINSHYPELNIAHFSHICLATAPENQHYGQQGDYLIPLQSHAKTRCYGELHHRGVTHRLTYNPHFHKLITLIDHFIDKII